MPDPDVSTPRPWTLFVSLPELSGERLIEVRSPDDSPPVVNYSGFDDAHRPTLTHLANAALIVRAVNSLAALEAVAEAAKHYKACRDKDFTFIDEDNTVMVDAESSLLESLVSPAVQAALKEGSDD
jgi:hypothetical protein